MNGPRPWFIDGVLATGQPTKNLALSSNVSVRGNRQEVGVSFLKRLLGRDEPPKPRVRVCVECGMPVAEHKNWCSILRGQIEMQNKTSQADARGNLT